MAVTSTGSNAELVVLDVAAVAVCGNSVCEIGERPIANTSSTIASAGDLFLSIHLYLVSRLIIVILSSHPFMKILESPQRACLARTTAECCVRLHDMPIFGACYLIELPSDR